MKNSLSDLNNHLFAQLERLGNESLEGDRLANEIDRTKAITSIAKEVVQNAGIALKAKALALEYGKHLVEIPGLKLIESQPDEK